MSWQEIAKEFGWFVDQQEPVIKRMAGEIEKLRELREESESIKKQDRALLLAQSDWIIYKKKELSSQFCWVSPIDGTAHPAYIIEWSESPVVLIKRDAPKACEDEK